MKAIKKLVYASLIFFVCLTSLYLSTDICHANSDKILFNDGKLKIYYEVTSSWNDGYNANILVENISDEIIEKWDISFVSTDNIYTMWGAEYDKTDNMYIASFFPYNSEIVPGEKIVIGYSAIGNQQIIDNTFVSYNEKKENVKLLKENIYEYEGYTINYQIMNSWENASNIQVSITNTSEEVIHNWGLKFISKDICSGMYNAKEIREGNIHIINSNSYNQDIPVGSTISFGYTQEYESQIDIPIAFELTCVEEVVDKSNYKLELVISNAWDNQKQAELIITNLSAEPIEDWTVELDCNFTINNIWNGEEIFVRGDVITIANADYVQNINSGESIVVGMIISCDGKPEINSASMYSINSHVKENAEKLHIVSLVVDQNVIPVGESISNIICVQLKGNTEADVRVYRYEDEVWTLAGLLLDDGNININGDEIANDGCYGNKLTMLSDKEDEILYKVEVSKEGFVYDTREFQIKAITEITDEEYISYYNNIDMVSETLREYLSGTKFVYEDLSDLISIVEEKYGRNGIVAKVEKINGNVIKIYFSSGLYFYFQITDENSNNMIRGGGSNSTEGEEIINAGTLSNVSIPLATVQSNQILLWSPFDTIWGESDETITTQEIIDESVYRDTFTILADEDASINSLKTLNEYGMIILATHGIGGEWIVTGERVTTNNIHGLELAGGEACVYVEYTSSQILEKRYMINEQWINNYASGEMPNSIIINNSCESSKTTKLWNAFEKKGAKTYFGYNDAVTNKYINTVYQTLLHKLLLEGYTTESAFEITLDAYYGGGSMEIYGQGNLIMPYGMNNGNFEDGLSGWMCVGDCRELTRIGSIKPTEGDYMASISTGIGYTMHGGAISQDMYIPENATKLYVDWNFLSAEYLEYIGSRYDDPYYISLTLYNDGKEVELGRYSVNTLAETYGASNTSAGQLICVSPEISINDYADIWMTNWITSEYDISSFSGETVKLKFSVQNAADTAYPTMVLIDNIHFDIETSNFEEYIPISDMVCADVVRTFSINDHGRSYIIYTDEFESVDGQANGSRDRIMYNNGYVDIEQVVMKKIATEQEFVDAWSSMEPGEGDEKIDEVNIIMHGSYYTLTIDADNCEYLTVSPDGVTAFDNASTRICDLPKKAICFINIYSCNTGLLDAININYDKKLGDESSTFYIKGNVAQAFLDSQDVDCVSAWDGSVVPGDDGSARQSRNQETYYKFWQELEYIKIVNVIRNNYSKISLWRQYISGDPDEIHNDPVGHVIYVNGEEGQYCLYTYHEKYWYGSELIHANIDIENNIVTDISAEDYRDRLDGVVGDENNDY